MEKLVANKLKIALVTGGTGGHIFPALAVAEELREQHHQSIMLVDKRFLKYKDQIPNWLSYIVTPSAKLSGNIFQRLISLLIILYGIIIALKIYLKQKPDIVVGFGGYISIPGIIAAKMLSIPIIIHEQNSVIGKANCILSRFANIITTIFPNTSGIKRHSHKASLVTNPVRKEILQYISPYEFNTNQKPINILITGGSQAAAIFSKILPKAISMLEPTLLNRLTVFHQARAEDVEHVKFKYQKNHINAQVEPFFSNIPQLLSQSQLIISRAGASIISEIIAIGRPAIFIPIQHSIGDHQYLNAKTLAENGAGWIIREPELSPESCHKLLADLLTHSEKLQQAAQKTKELYDNSGKKLTDIIIQLYQQTTK